MSSIARNPKPDATGATIVSTGIETGQPTIDVGQGDAGVGEALDPSIGTETEKRGRGRPRKTQSSEDGQGGSPSRKNINNRQAGEKAKGVAVDNDLFAKQIIGVHAMLAVLTKNETLNLSEKEGVAMAAALKNVIEEYSVVISPKTLAWLQLTGTCAAIYMPRLIVTKAKRDAKLKAMREAAAQAESPEFTVQ